MDETFGLWITIIMSGVLLIGVTWILTDRIVELRHRVNRLEIYRRLDEDEKFWEKTPKREWVGLTRTERFEIEKAMSKYYDYQHECKTVCLPEFAAAIEAKLKEKNT